MRDISLNNYTNTVDVIDRQQAVNISEYFKTLSDSAKAIADSPYTDAFINGDEESMQSLIDSYDKIIGNSENKSSSIEISKIIVADKDGKPLFTTGDKLTESDTLDTALKNIAEKTNDGEILCYTADVFADFAEDDRAHDDPIFGEKDKDKIRLITEYTRGDYSIIVLFGETRLKNFFTQSSFENNSRIILVDPLGSIIDSSYIGNISENKNSAYKQFVFSAPSGDDTVKIENFIGSNSQDIPTIGFAKKMPAVTESGSDSLWTIAMIAETSRAYLFADQAMGTIIGLIVLLAILLCAGAIVLVIIITKPIKTIRETLVKVSRGDHEARINFSYKNEYGEIADAFNELIDDIVVSESRYRTIVEMSDNIIFEWNLKTNEVFFSNNFNKKFSYRAPSDHFADSFLLKVKVHPDDYERYQADLEKLSKGEEFKNNEYRWKNIYGDYIWVLVRTSTVHNRDGSIAKIVGVIVDVDRAKRSELALTERASFDSLTSLYNRESIEQAIDNELHMLAARKSRFALLFIDVDDFKNFNDQYSHATGDRVLKFTAQTISDAIKGFGTAGRYGGDEFIVCIRNIDINDPSRIAREILAKLKDGFVSDSGEKLSVSTSIGISIVEDSSKTVDEIIGMADDAMYRIKKSGKSNFGVLDKTTIRSNPNQ